MSVSGWFKRKCVRLYVRIVREKASPEFIARGWAIGMFYGCLIPFGLQLICSIPTAFLLKGSKIGATVGTLITNHFTIFVIYPCQCYVGAKLLGHSYSYDAVNQAFADVLQRQSWESLGALGSELVTSFFLGGFLLAAIMTPITYFGIHAMVVKHRERVAKKKARRAEKEKRRAEERSARG